MNSKKTFLSIGALFFGALTFAQDHGEDGHIHSPLTCGVQDISYEEIQATKAMVAKLKAEKRVLNSTSSDGITYIPVKMHLFGNDDNTGFADETEVNDMLAELNKIYRKNQKFEFFFAGTSFNKYANSTMNDRGNGSTSEEEVEFHKNNGATDAINFYVSKSLRGFAGYSSTRPISQDYNFMYVVTRYLNDDKVTPHEFGHYFGLMHTFSRSNAIKNGQPDYTQRELVTRNFNEASPRLSANCNRTGDTFCDTPADPYGNGATSVSNCVVTGTPDANGDNYAPSMGNYMNYYQCGPYNFSPQQISYMQDGYLLMQPKGFFNAPETSQSAPTDLKALVGTYNGSVQLSWKDNSNVETGYIIEVAEKGTTDFIPVGGVKSNVETYKLTTNLDASKKYVFRVKPSNSKAMYSETSDSFEIPKLCASTGTTSCSGTGPATVINNVILTKGSQEILANRDSKCTGSATVNYFDTHIGKVNAGDVLGFKVEPTYGNGGSYYPYDVKIFCDWNNDGDFDDENEASASVSNLYSATGKFKIPENIPSGKYRLRVVLSDKGTAITACNAQGGEMEDYALEVTNATLSASEVTVNKGISFYPNPVSTQINLQNGEQYVSYEIYDASGRVVRNGKLVGNTINVNELNNGVYTLSLIDKKGQKSIARFIKKK